MRCLIIYKLSTAFLDFTYSGDRLLDGVSDCSTDTIDYPFSCGLDVEIADTFEEWIYKYLGSVFLDQVAIKTQKGEKVYQLHRVRMYASDCLVRRRTASIYEQRSVRFEMAQVIFTPCCT